MVRIVPRVRIIEMGLNTEPIFELPQKFESFDEETKAFWKKRVDFANSLKNKIIEVLEKEGVCELSWSCEGRTRHEMHANQWADALPQYDFEISYNYGCKVKVRESK